MARLSEKDIVKLLQEKDLEVVDISGYKNVKSEIEVKCKNGHIMITSLEQIKKPTFHCPNCAGNLTNNIHDSLPDKGDAYRVIALDQASQKIGISVYDNGKLVYYNLVNVHGDLDVRLKKIYKFLNEMVIPFWEPDFLVFEDIQLQNDNVQTYKVLSMVLGVCVMAANLNDIPHEEILNKVWQTKFNISGSNRALQKQNVIDTVYKYYKINVTDDVADAILLGNYAASKLEKMWFKSDF